ncbi:MAG: protein kinase [Planctomycetota bacterium]
MGSTDTGLEHAEELFLEHLEHLPGTPDVEGLCAAHPEHADRLRRLAEDWLWLEGQRRETRVDPAQLAPDAIDLLAQGGGADRYTVLDEVGRGAMGTVHRVWDARLRRVLAMKVSSARRRSSEARGTPAGSSRSLYRFLEEAQVMAQLDHPGVLAVHDVGVDANGRVWFTMHLVRGLDLKEVLRLAAEGLAGWSQARVVGVLVRVCETLAFAHAKQVLHRDLKPSNVMVGRLGETYVMDWGLARVRGREDAHAAGPDVASDSTDGAASVALASVRREDAARTGVPGLLTQDGAVIGTPSYMAPEQAAGDLAAVGPAADVYAAGAILYHLLAGRAPYSDLGSAREAPGLLRAVRAGAPTPLSKLSPGAPAELVAICDKAMARRADDRYRSMEALAHDLRAFLEGRVVSAFRTGPLVEMAKWVRRNRLAAAAAGLALVSSLAGSLGLAYVQTGRKNDAVAARGRVARESRRAKASEELAVAEKARADLHTYAALIAAAQSALEEGRADSARELLARCSEELRGWEWSFLTGQLDLSLMTLVDPGAPLSDGSQWGVEYSPAGRLLASGGDGGRVRVWDAATGELLQRLETRGQLITNVAFSPDGALLAAADNRGAVWLWDVPQALAGGAVGRLLYDAPGRSRDLVFHPDGKRIAGAHELVRITNVEDGADFVELSAGGTMAQSVDFSPDGSRLITAGTAARLRVFDTATWERLADLPSPDGRGYSHHRWPVRWSPDGERVAALTLDGKLHVLDAELRPVRLYSAHDARGWSTEFSPDGTLLATTGVDRTATVWDVASGEKVLVAAGHGGAVKGLSWHPSGEHLATSSDDGTVKVWSLARRRSPDRIDYGGERTSCLDFAPDGARFACGGVPGLLLWDLASATVVDRLSVDRERAYAVRFDPSGAVLASADYRGVVRLWDAATHERLADLGSHRERVRQLEFDPTGRRLVSLSSAEARVWSVERREPLHAAAPEGATLRGLAVAPDGRRFVTGSREGDLFVWRLGDGTLEHRVPGAHPTVNGLRFHPAQDVLVSFGDDDAIHVWDTVSWKRIQSFRGHHEGGVLSVAFSPDGRRLVSGGKDLVLRLRDFESGELVFSYAGLNGWVTWIEFGPRGDRILVSADSLLLFEPGVSGRDLPRLRRAASELHGLVAELFVEHVDSAVVVDELERRSDLSPHELAAAKHLAGGWADGPLALVNGIFGSLTTPGAPAEELELALRQARYAERLLPENPGGALIAGAARYRQGRFADAVEELERCNRVNDALDGRSHAGADVFLVLAHARLGEREQALRYLADCEAYAEWHGDPPGWFRELLVEARGELDAPGGARSDDR